MRRYDLDWLRVLVFGLLIFYHVGMFFVPWDYHLKNNVIYEWVRWPMLFVNQWRLSLLFVISGMGTCYALALRNGKHFAWERLIKLGIPLIAGMILIVPPQVFYERLANAQFTGTYLQFLKGPAFIGIYPEGNISWHHLWFLPYLLIYSLLLIPLFIYLRNNPTARFILWVKNWISRPFGIYLFVIPLYFTEAFLEPFFPVTHALTDDWFTFINFFILFFYGFVLISMGNFYWKIIDQVKKKALAIGIFSFSILCTIWLGFEDSTFVHFTEAFFKVINFWSWILVIFGYGAKYLNKPSKLLSYCNQAVYPFYILHQTVTIVVAYYLMNLDWGFTPKFLIISAATFLFSWIIYEFLIRRIYFVRPLFGLKRIK
ncbi:glucan biosynthesis protein [Cytophagales bacterium RKSG123]|nr:glucan biosynthesis protein [Xanthovirga aplysinae]